MNDNENKITNDNVKTNKDRPQNKNLISLADRTMEERQAIGRKGGLKTGEKIKARKSAQELLASILTKQMTDEQITEILGTSSTLLGGDKSAYNVMMVKALQGAMSGDVKSQVFVRDTVGDMPTTKTEVKADITESDKALIETVKNRLLG